MSEILCKMKTWVIGSFMMSTSSTSPNWLKYSLNRSWLVCKHFNQAMVETLWSKCHIPPTKKCHVTKKNYLPAEPAHKKFCQHRLSSSDLLNIIFIISNYHLETLWIQFRKSRLFTWLVFDIITKRTFLLNSICRQKLIWECLSKDNKLRFSFAHIKVLEYLKSCKPRFPRRSQGPPCLLSGPCNRLTVKFLSLNNFLKKERNKTCLLKNILISYLKMVLFENIKFTSLLFPPGQPLQLWTTTLMF